MKVLLLRGGADSIYIYNYNKFDKYIYLNYGQKQIDTELEIINNLPINYDIIKIDNLIKDKKGFYQCRNLKFLLTVLDNYPNVKNITFGTNANDKHPDNNRDFFDLMEMIIYSSYKKEIKILTPLKDLKKKEIIESLNNQKIKYYTD